MRVEIYTGLFDELEKVGFTLGEAALGVGVPLGLGTGIGSVVAPKGQGLTGAKRGATSSAGVLGGTALGTAGAAALGGALRSHPKLRSAAQAASILGGGAAGGIGGMQVAKKLFPYKEKKAEDRFTVVPESWSDAQKVRDLAMAEAFKEDPETQKAFRKLRTRGFLKGMGVGAATGLGLGAGISALSRGKIPRGDAIRLAGMVATPSALYGALSNSYDLEKKILAEKGISPTHLGLGRGRFTPGTMERYLEKEKKAEEQRKDITKDKLKRHLKAVAIIGAGAALGAGAGGIARRALAKNKGRIGELLRAHPKALKYAPAATGALGAGISTMAANLTRKHMRYTEKGDDGNNK